MRRRLDKIGGLLVLVSALVATGLGVPASGQVDWRSKVDAKVLEAAALGPTEFLVYLKEKANLGPAASLATKAEKGRFVYETLTAVARASQRPIVAELDRLGAQHQEFWIANLVWAVGDLSVVEAMAGRDDVAHVYGVGRGRLDPPAQVADAAQTVAPESNITHVRADEVWAMGYTGQGAVVANADTGVRWTHNALKNHYRGWNGTTADHNYNWHDAIHNPNTACPASGTTPCDDDTLLGGGHGSHTMGTIVGDDGGANQTGMAPGAKWIACRNMNNGLGVVPTYMECMEWFIAPTDLNNANPDPSRAPDVISNSWGCVEACPPPALQDTLQASRAAGIFYSVSAGNDGPECNTLQFPLSRYPESFTVGATNKTVDTIAGFSSRGPVLGDPTAPAGLLKPNIAAPGVSVRSSLRGSDAQYGSLSGTSMSSPHVAGLVALLISARPSLKLHVDELEDIIEQSAVHLTSNEGCGGDTPTQVPNNTFGWGRIDAKAAVDLALQTAEADLSVTKTASAARVATGGNLTYTVNVTNGGPDAASGVVLTDVLPSSVTFVSVTTTDGSCGESGLIVTCSLGTLGSGATATVQIVVTPRQAGTITNTASVASLSSDPNPANDSSSVDTSVCRISSRRQSIPCP